MEYDLAHNIIAKTQTHQQGVVNNHDQNLGSAFSVDKTNYHLQYNGYATGVNNTNAYWASFGNVQPHAVREIIETPNDSPLNENHPSYNKQTIEYDANGNQT